MINRDAINVAKNLITDKLQAIINNNKHKEVIAFLDAVCSLYYEFGLRHIEISRPGAIPSECYLEDDIFAGLLSFNEKHNKLVTDIEFVRDKVDYMVIYSLTSPDVLLLMMLAIEEYIKYETPLDRGLLFRVGNKFKKSRYNIITGIHKFFI